MAYENIKNQRADGKLNLSLEEMKEFLEWAVSPSYLNYRWPIWADHLADHIPMLPHLLPEVTYEANKDNLSFKCFKSFAEIRIYAAVRSLLFDDSLYFNVVKALFKHKSETFMRATASSLKRLTLPELGAIQLKDEQTNMNIYTEEVRTIRDTLMAILPLDVPLPVLFLYGPPGTGKTSLAKSIDVYAAYHTVIGTPRKTPLIEELRIAENEYNILIIDEIDKATDKMITELMQFLDTRDKKNCAVILTANARPDDLPKPLLRPGRVNKTIEVGFLPENIADTLFENCFGPVWKLAKKSYDIANNSPTSYQPASIVAMKDNWLADTVEKMLHQNIDVKDTLNRDSSNIRLSFKEACKRYWNLEKKVISKEEAGLGKVKK